MLIDIDNQTDLELPVEKLEKIAKSLTNREIDLVICDNETIKELNREYRGIDKATDVLSFPMEGEADTIPLGSIVISSDKVYQKAEEYAHVPQDESTLLFIHGLLHLLGYDHETDNGEMRGCEKELINSFGLPKSLIVRTE